MTSLWNLHIISCVFLITHIFFQCDVMLSNPFRWSSIVQDLNTFRKDVKKLTKGKEPDLLSRQYSVKLPLTLCNSTLVFNRKVIAALLSPSDNILWPPTWPISFTSPTQHHRSFISGSLDWLGSAMANDSQTLRNSKVVT